MSMENTIHKVIDELSFGLFSPQNIRRQSVAELQTADTYDEDGAPITSGLMSHKMSRTFWSYRTGSSDNSHRVHKDNTQHSSSYLQKLWTNSAS